MNARALGLVESRPAEDVDMASRRPPLFILDINSRVLIQIARCIYFVSILKVVVGWLILALGRDLCLGPWRVESSI